MKLIPLHGINGEGKFAQVDDEDYDFLMQWRWFGVYTPSSCNYYVRRNYNLGNGKWTHRTMHQLLIGKKEGFVIDHIDGNGLNNQRINLRYCKSSDNAKNRKINSNGTSQYKGVYRTKYYRRRKKEYIYYWNARISCDNKKYHLGTFPYTPEGELMATKVYEEKAKELFGEFHRINHYTYEPVKKSSIKVKKTIDESELILPPNSRAIPLTKGKYAIVSSQDYEIINSYTWCASHKENDYFAAIRHEKRVKGKLRKSVYMHNQIMNPPEGYIVDHINRNPLDNRRENLRLCLPYQNSANTRIRRNKNSSKYFGVFYHSNKWIATITNKGEKISLGRFPLTPEGEIMAAKAYNEAAIRLKGQFAHVNIIPLQKTRQDQ